MLRISLEVGHLLQEYADYLVGDICFQLRFEVNVCEDAKLALLLVAVVQHASPALKA